MPRGGRRAGSGRPPGYKAKAAERINEAIARATESELPELIAAAMALAKGCWVEKELFGEKKNTIVYKQPPDSNMIQYLINKSAGKPIQPTEISGADGQTLKVNIVHVGSRC